MTGTWLVAGASLAYLALLFGVAYWAAKRSQRGKSLIDNPLAYALSIAVFCTAWTYYGSVGFAARSGPLYLAVYVGPTLMAFTWWFLLRRIVRIAKEENVASVADFIAFRYGNSVPIGALAAALAFLGSMPYIGLQLKAVTDSFNIITHSGASADGGPDTALVVALIMSVFGILFGAGNHKASSRREGMVAAIAFEGIVKLVALFIVGAYITYGIYDGFGDIYMRMASLPGHAKLLMLNPPQDHMTPAWPTLLILSSLAVMLLPRQFHIMAVENKSEKNIPDAMWLFPLYLFLINIFVTPIAFAGILAYGSSAGADSFVLRLPMDRGLPVLSFIAYLGGLSAATGMIIVCSVALSTMFVNNFTIPLMLRIGWPKVHYPGLITNIKRLAVVGVCLAGYLYLKLVHGEINLVNMGLISFGAAAQLAPSVFGGLLWRQATGKGAATGLVFGLAVWIYTFVVPSLCEAHALPSQWLNDGPMGIWLLRPNALFGMEGLDVWTHGLFWTIFLNFGSFFVVSTFTRPTRAELEKVARVTYAIKAMGPEVTGVRLKSESSISELEKLLGKFVGPQKARRQIREFLGNRYYGEDVLPDREGIRLGRFVEKQIGAAIGPSAASEVVERYISLKGSRMDEILDVFGSISLSLEHSREELELRLRELAVLFDASRLLAATLDEKKAVYEILKLIENDFGITNRGFFLCETGRLRAVNVSGLHPRLLERMEGEPPSNSLVAKAVFTGKAVSGNAGEPEGYLEFLPRFGLTGAAAVPVIKDESVLGVLFLASRGNQMTFGGNFLEMLEALSGELAMAISNARLYSEIRELNRTLEEKVLKRTVELQTAMATLKELDRMKSEFLANISHELRTPMNSILGYTSLVLDGVDGPLTDDMKRSLERVENNARHLLDLINDLLDLSRIEAGKMKLEMAPVDIGDSAMEVCADLDSIAQQKKVNLECTVKPGDHVVTADPVRVKEVMLNLVGNALKFTSQGTVAVTVDQWKGEEEDGGVKVLVEDTGQGIPEEHLGEIFEAFKQLDGSTTRIHGGAGLGLSIAKKLVEMHGGKIIVTSRVGVGSVFTVWWPKNIQDGEGASDHE